MKTLFYIILVLLGGVQLNAQSVPSLVFSGGKNFVGKDVIQIEYGLDFQREIQNLNSVNRQLSQYGLIRYGVNNGLDIDVSYNNSRQQTLISDQVRRSNGLSNFSAGVRKKLAKNYTLQSNIGFSRNADSRLETSFQILAISEHNIDSYLAWENNLGLNWSYNSPQANLNYLTGLTFTIPYPLDLIFEYYGQYGEEAWNNYANIGLGYYFSKDLMTEIYAGYGNTLKQESVFVSINFFWRLVPAKYYKEEK